MGVVAAVLGHSPSIVTNLDVSIPIEDQVAALNRAAILIDGEPQASNVFPLAKTAQTTAQRRSVG